MSRRHNRRMSTAHIKKQIQADIEALAAFDKTEQAHKEDILQWIASGTNLFRIKKPDTPPKHLVSYFVLVDPEHKSVLLVDHIKAQLWIPTGGHVLKDEHPVKTVERESMEELNQSAIFLHNNTNPFFITVNRTGGLTPGHIDVSLWYLLRGSVHSFINFDRAEFGDIEWFTFDEILESDPIIFDRHMHRFIKKLARHLSKG